MSKGRPPGQDRLPHVPRTPPTSPGIPAPAKPSVDLRFDPPEVARSLAAFLRSIADDPRFR